MFKKDAIYNVLRKYDRPFYRGRESAAVYLENCLSTYCHDINEALDKDNTSITKNPFLGKSFLIRMKEKIGLLNQICSCVPRILHMYDRSNIAKSYIESQMLFNSIQDSFLSYCVNSEESRFYRVRSGDWEPENSISNTKAKRALFHISMKERNKIKSFRFSVTGRPCLYLSSTLELAWLESGMPRDFSYCVMKTSKDERQPTLIDISRKPVDFLSGAASIIETARLAKQDCSLFYNNIVKYILTYPIAIACSLEVCNRSSSFVEEYVFPQLLMEWISTNEKIDGVCYKSSLHTRLIQDVYATNIALPTKDFREDGLDKRLTNLLLISDIKHVDTTESFRNYSKGVNELNDFRLRLQEIFLDNDSPEDCYIRTVRELNELCSHIIDTYTSLIEGAYSDANQIWLQINELFFEQAFFNTHRDALVNECSIKDQCNASYEKYSEYLSSLIDSFTEITRKFMTRDVILYNIGAEPGNFGQIML